MGSAIENGAANVSGPIEGQIRVLALTTSASAVQDLTEFMADSSLRRGEVWVTFVCSARWYMTCGSTSTITDPDSTSTSGNGRCWEIPADVPFPFRVTKKTAYFKARGSASANLRWTVSENRG